MATLKVPSQVPSPAEDSEQLRKAFQGWGTNEDLIISILAHRNAAQRKLIHETYSQTYGEDLLTDLDKELSSDFERAVVLWTLGPAERDAFLVNEATKRLTKNNWILMEIASTRSSLDLFKAKQAYQARFKRSIEEDVAYHTSGDIRKLLVPLVGTFRYDGDEVNMILAKSEAKLLHEKIAEKAYNHEDLLRVITTRSKAQLNATLNHYNNEFGNEIDKEIGRSNTMRSLCCQMSTMFGCVWFSVRKSVWGIGIRDYTFQCPKRERGFGPLLGESTFKLNQTDMLMFISRNKISSDNNCVDELITTF